MKRRQFIKYMAAMGTVAAFPPLGKVLYAAKPKPKVMVLGIDGMDVSLTRRFLHEGMLPNIKRLLKNGTLMPMQTSTPPQSPVAWSNVITGAPPGVHGIYDFIHRRAETMEPYLSTSEVAPPKRVLHLGNHKIPLSAGETRLLRQGEAFWDPLGKKGIPTTIFKMPANFPCRSDQKVNMVSGMGTPDLRGGYGSYTLVATASDLEGQDLSGGIVIPVQFSGGRADFRLPGPANSLRDGNPESEVPVTIWRDKKNPVVRIRLQDNEILLKQGQWSGWQEIAFPMLGPLVNARGICKILIKQVHPEFSMYISPINISPTDPSLPVAYPESYAGKLSREVGMFYTQGFPEDTKALSEGILSEEQYLGLASQIFDERKGLMDYELERFSKLDSGMLFFYFSSLDQNTHMYWRTLDKANPLYCPELAKQYGNTILSYYLRVDEVIKQALDTIDIRDPDTTLIVMSDHGFGSFNRQVNLNTWLYEKGFLALNGRLNQVAGKDGYFPSVNWERTGAYNVGINCLYLNLKGRESRGIVTEGQARSLLKMLCRDLMALRDPQTGEKAISRVRIVPPEEHRRHPHAPDLIIGWNNGYRNSWKSILGSFESDVIKDNTDKWSGDHCIDPVFVPALLMSSRRISKKSPSLCDIGPTILDRFGIQPGSEMSGSPLFQT